LAALRVKLIIYVLISLGDVPAGKPSPNIAKACSVPERLSSDRSPRFPRQTALAAAAWLAAAADDARGVPFLFRPLGPLDTADLPLSRLDRRLSNALGLLKTFVNHGVINPAVLDGFRAGLAEQPKQRA